MNVYLVTLCLLYLLFVPIGVVWSRVTCIGENGTPVNMYVLYKLPKIKDGVSEFLRNGTAYAYIDAEMLDAGKTKFQLSAFSIGSAESAVGHTLNQVYQKNKDDQAHAFYNDEDIVGKSYESNGHTKGAIAFDSDSGFWLIHSVPRAYPPPASAGYSYPSSGHMYGQMFICVTFNASTFNDIGLQLRYNNPHIHDFELPGQMEDDFPNVRKLGNGEMMKDEPHYNVMKLHSNDGSMDFLSFAKYTTFHKDLYSSLVAPTLEANLLTETWQHASHDNINSTCDVKYTVEDISAIQLDCGNNNNGDGLFPFSNFHDHSKFAIGKEAPYVCVGDINRQVSQYKRAGGTLCTKSEQLHVVFRNLAQQIHQCSGNYSDEL